MKFVTDSVTRSAARIGTLTEFVRIPEASFETPAVLVYTRTGCVPHLTKDVLKRVTKDTQMMSLSLPTTIPMLESLKELDVSYSDFVSMPEYIHFLSIQDTGTLFKQGALDSEAVGIWTRNGRCRVTASRYMDLVEAFKPDVYMTLCDGDTNVGSSVSRTKKAVYRSNRFLEECVKRHVASNTLKSTSILGSVEGGYNLEYRKESIEFLRDKPLSGYVIDGLHSNDPEVQNIKTEQFKEIMHHTLNLLPAEKLKVSLGCWNPVTLLDLIDMGVDLFDSTYAYIATENHTALTFLCNDECCNHTSPIISIQDERYKDDFSPVCKHCECLACKNHTRAYMNHLYLTKEMLGSVLLMMHNTHTYLKFFRTIRESIKNGTFDEYRKKISAKFPHKRAKSVSPCS